jgi:FkbM family methyltransferase
MGTIADASLVQTLGRFAPRPLRRWGRWMLSPEHRARIQLERELQRLKELPRYQTTTTDLLGMEIEVPDGASFAEMYGEIFRQEMYAFHTSTSIPYIVDGGANIGLTTLYFKRLYPRSEIVAFEADQRIFSILERNIRRCAYSDVTLVPCALAATEGPKQFVNEGSYAGRLARKDDAADGLTNTVRLRPYLNRHVDMLKLNIEGAETEVIQDCADLLCNVDNLVLEYHSFEGEAQTLHRLLGVLASAGFRLHVNPTRNASQPLIQREVLLGMDLQMYIFGFRT